MAVIPFQRPDKVVMQRGSEFEGIFEFSPLEKGYGVTIGNSLRRILLSSLEGYAITNMRMPGVDHEFASIPGVIEDVTEIILNLKQVRLKHLTGEDQEKIFITVSGQDRFMAGDLSKASGNFQVLNPDLVICHMEPSVRIEMELQVEKGRGYINAEDNKPKDAPIGVIAIDAIYSPVVKVRYNVENTRVGQNTEYEKLVIELNTDGSISPEDALKSASNILIQHFAIFTDSRISFEAAPRREDVRMDEKYGQTRKLLKTSLADLDLSVRAYNCLRAAEIRTIGDLVHYTEDDLMRFRNFGRKSLNELKELVIDKGLVFGMDLAPYNLEQD